MDRTGESECHERGQQVWEEGWSDHNRRQLKRLAALPLAEKLAWLEEAHRFVLHIQSKHTHHRNDE